MQTETLIPANSQNESQITQPNPMMSNEFLAPVVWTNIFALSLVVQNKLFYILSTGRVSNG